jgi:HAD superfamily hydrolase (TIGR01509 family)
LNLKGILIDFGDTLAHVDKDENTRYEEALLSVLRKHGYRPTFEDVDSTLTDLYGDSSKGGFRNLRQFWTAFLRKLSIREQEALIKDFEEVRSRLLVRVFKLYEGVFPTLSILQKKYKLVPVSNCAVSTRDEIVAMGLTRFFEHVILSYEVGARKPNGRIYLEALQALGLDADECIFVADEISDLEGAKAVGLRTMLVRQGSNTLYEAKDPDFKPDFRCNRISEITQFL